MHTNGTSGSGSRLRNTITLIVMSLAVSLGLFACSSIQGASTKEEIAQVEKAYVNNTPSVPLELQTAIGQALEQYYQELQEASKDYDAALATVDQSRAAKSLADYTKLDDVLAFRDTFIQISLASTTIRKAQVAIREKYQQRFEALDLDPTDRELADEFINMQEPIIASLTVLVAAGEVRHTSTEVWYDFLVDHHEGMQITEDQFLFATEEIAAEYNAKYEKMQRDEKAFKDAFDAATKVLKSLSGTTTKEVSGKVEFEYEF